MLAKWVDTTKLSCFNLVTVSVSEGLILFGYLSQSHPTTLSDSCSLRLPRTASTSCWYTWLDSSLPSRRPKNLTWPISCTDLPAFVLCGFFFFLPEAASPPWTTSETGLLVLLNASPGGVSYSFCLCWKKKEHQTLLSLISYMSPHFQMATEQNLGTLPLASVGKLS